MEWYTWVFSGLGVAILGWIGSIIFCKRNDGTKKAKIKGDGNTANQNSDNSSITITK